MWRGDPANCPGYREDHACIADQAVKHRGEHREEQAPDRGDAGLVHGGPLSWRLARC